MSEVSRILQSWVTIIQSVTADVFQPTRCCTKCKARTLLCSTIKLGKYPGRSSVVQLYLGSLLWMDLYFYFSFSLEPRNRTDLRQTQNTQFTKNKNTACYCKCCCNYTSGVIRCELVVLPSGHCFRNPDAMDPRLCLLCNILLWLRKTLEEVLQDTAWKSVCEYSLTNIARACNYSYHKCVNCALSYVKSGRRSD